MYLASSRDAESETKFAKFSVDEDAPRHFFCCLPTAVLIWICKS